MKYPSEIVVRFIYRNLPIERNKRKRIKILDVGCGAGRHTVLLAKEGFKSFGTDYSGVGILLTKRWIKKEGLKAVVKKANMDSQPFKDNFFHCVIAFAVLYYNDFEGFKKAVDEIYRVLKHNGLALILARSTKDRRFTGGHTVGKNTILVERNELNEKGLLMHFLDRGEIKQLFSKFKILSVETEELTYNGMKEKDSDFVIILKK